MEIKGIVFSGTATDRADETAAFFRSVFAQEPEPLEGFPAQVFNFSDGSSFGVVQVPEEMATRTIGFQVDDLDAAATELRDKGIQVGEIGSNLLGRYIHFTATDGRLYELVEKPA